MRRIQFLILPLALLTLSGCGGKPEFKKFTAKDGGWSVLFPGGNPERKTMRANGIDLVAYGVTSKRWAFLVAWGDLPQGVGYDYNRGLRGIAGNFSGEITINRPWSFAGNKGIEFQIKSKKPKGYVSGRLIVINRRVFQITGMGNSETLSSSDVQKFLNSFELTK